MRRSNRHAFRRSQGVSLAELLLATALIGISMTALAQIMGIMTLSASRLNNRTEAIDSSRIAISRIAGDIRAARCIGEFNGADSSKFPNSNPNSIYGNVTPPSGWPTGWDPPPYVLSPTCLILQLPVFYERQDGSKDTYSGLPLKIPADEIQPGIPAESIEDFDTVVYKVVQTNADPVEYSLQVCRIPGYNSFPKLVPSPIPLSFRGAISSPQTVVHGITGPLDVSTGFPRVFSYYLRDISGLQLATDSQVSNNAKSIVGVSIDLDVKRPDALTKGSKIQSQQVGIHSESFLRANRNITLKDEI